MNPLRFRRITASALVLFALGFAAAPAAEARGSDRDGRAAVRISSVFHQLASATTRAVVSFFDFFAVDGARIEGND